MTPDILSMNFDRQLAEVFNGLLLLCDVAVLAILVVLVDEWRSCNV